MGILAYDPFALLFTIGVLLSGLFHHELDFSPGRTGVPPNAESAYISALILALIITPYQTPNDLWFLVWAGVLAMASKYIVAIRHTHIFNPIAFAVALTYLTINQTAKLVGRQCADATLCSVGWNLDRASHRAVRSCNQLFLATALLSTLALAVMNGENLFSILTNTIFYSPLFFFAFVILTEPLTTPPTSRLRIVYGMVVGLLFAPQLHFGGLYMTPELAILAGNVLSFLVSPKTTLVLRLVRKAQLVCAMFMISFSRPHENWHSSRDNTWNGHWDTATRTRAGIGAILRWHRHPPRRICDWG